jgi:phosphoenolpyruvate synthase/pyruvate phosphate dikinase
MLFPEEQHPTATTPGVMSILQSECRDQLVVGAKAARLAQCARSGLAIPPAIIFPWQVLSSRSGDRLWREGLELLAPAGPTVILRSSARTEDGSARSHAGRFQSEFIQPTATAIAAAADSILSHAASQGEHCCSLILQEVPHVVWGGVCFSRHPLFSDQDVILLEATRGGGQSVAQGERTEVTAVIERTKPWDVFLHGTSAFTEVLARRIGGLAVGLELLYASPQDIEWVLDIDDRLWLVQTRPITTAAKSSTEAPGGLQLHPRLCA